MMLPTSMYLPAAAVSWAAVFAAVLRELEKKKCSLSNTFCLPYLIASGYSVQILIHKQ